MFSFCIIFIKHFILVWMYGVRQICNIIMENIESSWNILMDINFKILQSKYFNYYDPNMIQ